MSRSSLVTHATALSCAVALVLFSPACGDDSGSDEGDAGSGSVNMPGGGSPSSSAGASSGDEAGSSSSSGGAGEDPPGGAGRASGGASSVAGTGLGGAPAAGGAGNAEPPGPAPGGGSVYAVECSGMTEMCGVERAHCLGINLDTGGVGYSCSNHCSTVDDCSDAPSGAPAEVGCVQFTQEKRCVLVCYNQPNEYACPDGMSCYIYPNSPIGYCLWVQ